jgi:predicted LPLAT superfamily acyltransferase
MKLNPLATRTGREIVSTWLWAVADTFNLLGRAARKAPKKEPIKAPSWFAEIEGRK